MRFGDGPKVEKVWEDLLLSGWILYKVVFRCKSFFVWDRAFPSLASR